MAGHAQQPECESAHLAAANEEGLTWQVHTYIAGLLQGSSPPGQQAVTGAHLSAFPQHPPGPASAHLLLKLAMQESAGYRAQDALSDDALHILRRTLPCDWSWDIAQCVITFNSRTCSTPWSHSMPLQKIASRSAGTWPSRM